MNVMVAKLEPKLDGGQKHRWPHGTARGVRSNQAVTDFVLLNQSY